MKTKLRTTFLMAVVAGASLLAACGGVSGTYAVEGGGYQIEFQSGGKAVESLGPQKDNCTYTEVTGKSVTLTCTGGPAVTFTINDKGQLIPPSGSMLSMMGPMTKK